MAVIEGGVSGALGEVDLGSLAQRTSIRPTRTLAWNSLGAVTGALTLIAAGGRIFSLRNTHGSNLILVRRVGIGFMTTTAFTASQPLDFGLAVARSFTVADSVGTDTSPTGNITKHRTSLATPNVAARISAAAVVSGGTLTVDTSYLGMAAGGSTGLATGLNPVQDNLLQHATADLPVVLAANEGIVINNLTVMGVGGVVKIYINLEFAEIAAVDYA